MRCTCKITIVTVLLLTCSFSFSQTPANPSEDIIVTEDFTTVSSTEATFNEARRAEEMDFELEANSIADLDLPEQSIWDSWSLDKQVLYLLNDERKARAGIDYGDGPVTGYPLQGVEKKIDDVAQSYADYLRENNLFDHNEQGSPTDRINDGVGEDCIESTLTYEENLQIQVVDAPPFTPIAEFAVFRHNYQDAPDWGHRMADLSQDYQDNNGPDGKEGFVGIGYSEGPYTYMEGFDYGMVLVFNFFDPVPDASAGSCGYNITVDDSEFDNIGCPSDVTISDLMISGEVLASGLVETSGQVTTDGATVFSGGEVVLNQGFCIPAGHCFEASVDGCNYFGPLICEEEPPDACLNPQVITCGSPYNGNNNTGSNVWEEYDSGNATDYTGPERVHTVIVPSLSSRLITLSGLAADLDMFIGQSCDRNDVSYQLEDGTTSESILLMNTQDDDETYYIFIDGYQGAISNYTLSCVVPASLGQ